ncbi:MAG: RNA ligase family protein [Candidatus Nanoarchaeia archaeon]|nr:RNA ligase family protein [Candidatus Nanoarchaeia archaeon]
MENELKSTNESANIRKLATIAKILNIVPIEGADNIEMAYIRGWHVVVKKGEFKPGNFCIYVEVDSVLPDGMDPEKALEWKSLQKQLSKAASDDDKEIIKNQMDEISKLNTRPEFEFLRSSKFRIKTKRIFEEISQGICFPLSILYRAIFFTGQGENDEAVEMIDFGNGNIQELQEDIDVTEFLGVIQFVPPDPAIMGGDQKGDLENVGVLISDEERLENLSGKYSILRQFRYYKTEKLEGTSFTAYLKNGVFGVCGRTIEFKIPEENTPLEKLNVYWKIARKFDIENKLRKLVSERNPGLSSNIALQGELIGEGIQSNIYKLKGQVVYFYNAFIIEEQTYMEYELFIKMIKDLDLLIVPILDMDFELPENPQELLLEVDKFHTTIGNSNHLAEGWVFIAKGPIPKGLRVARSSFGRLSFKAKSRTYQI